MVAAFLPLDYRGVEYRTPMYRPPPVPVGQVRDEIRSDAERTVQDVAGEMAAETAPPPVTVRAVAGGAAEVLLHAAEGAELLVVGSRRGGVRSVLLGSVSLACAQHSPCPVTVVRPREDAAGDRSTAAPAAPSRS